MRVLLVPNTAASMVWFRLPFLAALRARGHRVWVAAPEGPGVDRIVAAGASFLPLFASQGWSHGVEAPKGSYLSVATDLDTVRAIRRACRVVRPDLVLAYTHKMTLLAPIAARSAGVPHVHGMITGLGFANLGGGPKRELLRLGYHASLAVAARACDSLIVLNADNRDELVGRGIAPSERVYLMDGEGIDTGAWDAPAPRPAGRPLVVAMVARLVWHKGVGTFVEAARRVRARRPDVRFVLAGGSDPRHPDAVPESTLAAWRAEGAVELPGFVDDMRAFYAAADVFVLPSAATEGLPMSILEAMAMRRPIVTTRAPGNRETVDEGVNGFLVDEDDPAAIAAAVDRLAADPELVVRMGEASRARAVARFDAARVNDGLLRHLGL